MFFFPDSTIAVEDLEANIKDYVSGYKKMNTTTDLKDSKLTIKSAIKILERLHSVINQTYLNYPSPISDVFKSGNFNSIWSNIGLKDYQADRLIKRFEFAALLDSLLYPFNINVRYINITGK